MVKFEYQYRIYEGYKMEQMKSYCIFLVEDDVMLSEEISKLLMKCGYNVIIAEIFDNILDEFVEAQTHVVLMERSRNSCFRIAKYLSVILQNISIGRRRHRYT